MQKNCIYINNKIIYVHLKILVSLIIILPAAIVISTMTHQANKADSMYI